MKWLLIVLVMAVSGCGSAARPVLPEIVQTGNDIAGAKADVEGSDSAFQILKPQIPSGGKDVSQIIDKLHGSAIVKLDKGAADLSRVNQANAQIQKHDEQTEQKYEQLYNSTWEHIWRVFVWLWWLAWALVAIHFIALGISIIWPVSAVGAIAYKVATIVNPFVWFQKIADKLIAKRTAPPAEGA